MIRKQDRRLRVGVLGCGPIAQFAHLESCVKASNADLYAICDAAPDLLQQEICFLGAQSLVERFEMIYIRPQQGAGRSD